MSSNNSSEVNFWSNEPLLPFWFRLIMHICYITTFLIGLVGNVLMCYVIISRKRRRRGIHLLTLNLGISDLIVLLLYLPAEMYQIESDRLWDLGKTTCQLIYCVNSITVNASIGTLMMITRDRYVAVIKPMSIARRTTSLIKGFIGLVWMVSIFLTIPLFLVADIESGYCTENWPNLEIQNAYWITVFVLQFLLPLFFLSITYGIIINRMRLKRIPTEKIALRNNEDRDTINRGSIRTRKRQQKQLLKMSIILVIAYTLCVSPQHAFYFLSLAYKQIAIMSVTPYLFTIANFMMILNSSLNSVIYGALNDEMNRLIQKLFLCKKLIPGKHALYSSSLIEIFRNTVRRVTFRQNSKDSNKFLNQNSSPNQIVENITSFDKECCIENKLEEC